MMRVDGGVGGSDYGEGGENGQRSRRVEEQSVAIVGEKGRANALHANGDGHHSSRELLTHLREPRLGYVHRHPVNLVREDDHTRAVVFALEEVRSVKRVRGKRKGRRRAGRTAVCLVKIAW